jgi:ABC-type long-subunit fatty acid transport system fused permease/ATPase subunit
MYVVSSNYSKHCSVLNVGGSVYRRYISKYNKQDATLHTLFNSVKCSTCFRRYLHPSPGAQKLYIQHRVLVKTLLLSPAIVEELELFQDSGRQQ